MQCRANIPCLWLNGLMGNFLFRGGYLDPVTFSQVFKFNVLRVQLSLRFILLLDLAQASGDIHSVSNLLRTLCLENTRFLAVFYCWAKTGSWKVHGQFGRGASALSGQQDPASLLCSQNIFTSIFRLLVISQSQSVTR